MNGIRNWMIDTANILFDDSKNDLRALPKTVRLNILLVLSTVWSTVFTVFVFTTMNQKIYGWAGLVVGHVALIWAVYYTFKQFHNAQKKYDYKFGSYHSEGRARGGMIGLDGTRVKWDPKDPGGEHE